MHGFLEKILSKTSQRGISEVEVYAVHRITRQLDVSNERISGSVITDEYDIGVRGVVDGKTSGIRTNTIDIDIDRFVDKLYSAIHAAPKDPYWSGFPREPGVVKHVSCHDEKAVEIGETELVDVLVEAMNTMKEPVLGRGIDKATVVEGSMIINETELNVLNSHGLSRNMTCTNIALWLTLSVFKQGQQSDRSLIYISRKLDLEEIRRKARETGEEVLLFLGAAPLESGVYDIILRPEVTGEIINYSLAPAFSALNILENRSPLRNRLGEQVFSDVFTLVDDPFIDMAPGSRSFDDEGVATSIKPVVEKGVFRNILHTHYTARRMNTVSTGNALRAHPATQPIPGFMNLVIKPVEGDLDGFIRDAGKAIVVYEVIGYWMSDPVTGGVKATITHGLLVEGGNVVKGVKGMVLGGSIYDWLSRDLVAVGRDTEIVGNVIAPSIWIRGVRVGGA